MNRRMPLTTASALSVSALAMSLIVPAAATVEPVGDPATFTIFNFHYRYQHMPDFDQVRGSGIPVAVNGCPPGGANCNVGGGALPACGVMYCGPTAGTNLLTYIAHHGFPDVLNANGFMTPGGFNPNHDNWDAWQAQHYAQATQNITRMRQFMRPLDPNRCDGVWPLQMYHGMRNALAGQKMIVEMGTSHGPYAPNFAYAGWTMARGYVCIFCYGRYTHAGNHFGIPILVAQNSGHVVTLQEVKRDASSLRVWVRDPGDDLFGPAFNPTTQSGFARRQFNILNGWVWIVNESGQPPHLRYVSVMLSPSEPAVLLLHTVVAVRPVGGWAIKPAAAGVAGSQSEIVLLEPSEWSNSPLEQSFPSPSGTAILDAVQHPDGNSMLLLTESAGAGQPAQIWRLHPQTGQAEMLADIEGATRMTLGRNRLLYVLAGNQLHAVDATVPEEEMPKDDPPSFGPPGKPAGPPGPVTLPVPAQALDYDNQTDEVVLLSMTNSQILRYDQNLEDPPVVKALPAEIPAGPDGDIAVISSDAGADASLLPPMTTGLFVLGPDGSPATVHGLHVNPSGLLEVDATLPLPAGSNTDSICIDDDFFLYAVVDGKLVVWRYDEGLGQWVEVDDSEFAQFDVGKKFDIGRSHGNYVEGVHDDPTWTHIPPEELNHGWPVSDCLGDVNLDLVVDVADLAIIINAWGPLGPEDSPLPDFDSNFKVDVDELLTILNHWGPCPLPPG